MPIPTTLDTQFSSLSMTENDSKVANNATPTLISPTKSERSFGSSDDESSTAEEQQTMVTMLAKKTAHKLKEEQGLFSEEPLLKENPFRFVLFPIQDNDVRTISVNDQK